MKRYAYSPRWQRDPVIALLILSRLYADRLAVVKTMERETIEQQLEDFDRLCAAQRAAAAFHFFRVNGSPEPAAC